jgi:hypothetical protein
MEEKSRKQGRVEAPLEEGQRPEGAVAPYMKGSITYSIVEITHIPHGAESFLRS